MTVYLEQQFSLRISTKEDKMPIATVDTSPTRMLDEKEAEKQLRLLVGQVRFGFLQ